MVHPVCIHIGLPKTATTTLQQSLFAHHSQVELLGKRAGREADRALRRCSSEAAFHLANQLFWEHVDSIDIAEAKRLLEEEIFPSVAPSRLLIYSFEGLSAANLETRTAIARNLRDVFGSCRIMIGIRRPLEFVEAVYFQRLKRRHLGLHAKRFEAPCSPSPREWLESVVAGDELANHLDYARTIEIMAGALGRENVGVFAIEHLTADPIRFARALCGFLGIDATEGVRLIEGRRHNVRMSQTAADRMLRFERPGMLPWIYANAGRATRKRMIRFASQSEAAAHLSIPPEVRQAIEDRTRDGNRWIGKEWDLPLEEFGYPI